MRSVCVCVCVCVCVRACIRACVDACVRETAGEKLHPAHMPEPTSEIREEGA